MTELDFPVSVYAATTDPEYRKPRLGMWREFLDDYDLDIAGVDSVSYTHLTLPTICSV